MRRFALTFALTIVATSASAGISPGVIAELGAYGRTGYREPWVGYGVTLDLSSGPACLSMQALRSDTDKIRWKVSNLYGKAMFSYRVGRFKIGTGVEVNSLTFQPAILTRTALRPLVFVGRDLGEKVTLSAIWIMAGWDKAYRVQRGVLAAELRPVKHIAFIVELSGVHMRGMLPTARSMNWTNAGVEFGWFVRIRR